MKFNVPISEVISIIEYSKGDWTIANEMSYEGGFTEFDLTVSGFYESHKFLLGMNHHEDATVSLCSKDYTDMMNIKQMMEDKE